jgi:hypothetical protein
MIGGKPADMVEFLLTAEEWRKCRDRQLPLAHLAGKQVLEWEEAQLGERQPWEETDEQPFLGPGFRSGDISCPQCQLC